MAGNTLAKPEQVAEWLQVSPDKLRKMRRPGADGPKFIKVGREVRYAWSDVHAWCAKNRTASTERNTP